MQYVLPDAAPDTRALAADLIRTTLSEVGGRFSAAPRAAAEIHAYADALADMVCGYLEDLRRRSSRPQSDQQKLRRARQSGNRAASEKADLVW